MKNIKRSKMPAMKLMGLLLVTYLIGASFSSLSAKSVGQFYWHLPSIKFNSGAEYPATTLGTGFHVTAGELDTPAHQADIGFLFFALRPSMPVRNSNIGTESVAYLGYVYHWSDNYDFDERSNNVHFGIGVLNAMWSYRNEDRNATDPVRIGDSSESFSNSGWYWRLAYFRSIPSSKRATLIGFSVVSKYYTRSLVSRAVTTAVDSDGEAIESVTSRLGVASIFNSTDLSLIIGTRF